MDDGTYVRRRRWSSEEKRAVVTEALSSGNVIATAKRHGIQAQQIYRWRLPGLVSTAHTIRAILFARATITLFLCIRCSS